MVSRSIHLLQVLLEKIRQIYFVWGLLSLRRSTKFLTCTRPPTPSRANNTFREKGSSPPENRN